MHISSNQHLCTNLINLSPVENLILTGFFMYYIIISVQNLVNTESLEELIAHQIFVSKL